MGLMLPDLLRAEQAKKETSSTFGRAKSCIFCFMFGAPAHQDIWDLKPDSSEEVRGPFNPISTSVPGTQFGEHIPKIAGMADRFALIRSVTHPDSTHTVAMHYMQTGVRHRRPNTNPTNLPDDFPCFGATMNLIHRQSSVLPAGVSLNAPGNEIPLGHIFPGFFAGFIGNHLDPMFVTDDPSQPDFNPFPTGGINVGRRFDERTSLLGRLDQLRRRLDHVQSVRSVTRFQEKAIRVVNSPEALNAFDLTRETTGLRDQYGMTPFGQGCLLARRLVESGVRLVTVNWERDDAFWDTHADNFNKHKKSLLPNLDRGFSALLEDMQQRGLLDDTLIVWLAEFGRTPKINAKAGRDHWAACNTVLLAGAGIPGGQVYGASDRQAAYPARDPVAPEDLSATIYHLLGIDPHQAIHSPDGRPVALSNGELLSRVI